MTHKYERQCWSCGSKNMEKDERGAQCQDCGATWNPVPSMGSGASTEKRDYTLGGYGVSSKTSGSPSGTVQRRAARARQKEPH